ncbi:MAG TPA: pitrilysin family protein [Ignavibacteria bacterium]|nr:pitrilysin family protein [Ignavibacteria bacterium]
MTIDLDFRQYTLENGLKIILHQNKKNPLINLTLGYKVGSKNEKPGKKGIAHLFEHMMFQGSENVDRSGHFKSVQNAGGLCNAFTMQDLTVYFETLPSGQLETALWLESDRMNALNISEENLANQKSVVIEEKKQRYDNSPYGTANLNIYKNIFKGTPYESPVIGFENDINSFSVNEAIEFHNKFYSPANSVLILTGDFQEENALNLIKKYFGNIENKNSPDALNNFEYENIEKTNSLIVEDKITLPAMYLCFKASALGSETEFSIEFIANLLANNKSSRLYKKLVYEKNLAKSVYVAPLLLKYGGVVYIKTLLYDKSNFEEVEKIIIDELNDLYINKINDDEIMKIKNEVEFAEIQSLTSVKSISLNTLMCEYYYGSPDFLNKKAQKYLSIYDADIKKTLDEVFINKNIFKMYYIPEKK